MLELFVHAQTVHDTVKRSTVPSVPALHHPYRINIFNRSRRDTVSARAVDSTSTNRLAAICFNSETDFSSSSADVKFAHLQYSIRASPAEPAASA